MEKLADVTFLISFTTLVTSELVDPYIHTLIPKTGSKRFMGDPAIDRLAA